MKPALTAEEWTAKNEWHQSGRMRPLVQAGDVFRYEDTGELWYGDEYRIERPHAAAALCLHGQPFGFTHEDVTRLRKVADGPALQIYGLGFLHEIADRIEALIPPKAP